MGDQRENVVRFRHAGLAARLADVLDQVEFHHVFCTSSDGKDAVRVGIRGSHVPFLNASLDLDPEFPLRFIWISSRGECSWSLVERVRGPDRDSTASTMLITLVLQGFEKLTLEHPDIDLSVPGSILGMGAELRRIPPRDRSVENSTPKSLTSSDESSDTHGRRLA